MSCSSTSRLPHSPTSASQLAPGGRIAFSCWQPIERNPWFFGAALAGLASAPAPARAGQEPDGSVRARRCGTDARDLGVGRLRQRAANRARPARRGTAGSSGRRGAAAVHGRAGGQDRSGERRGHRASPPVRVGPRVRRSSRSRSRSSKPPLSTARKGPRRATRSSRPHRPQGLAHLPRHHDVRPPGRRARAASRSSTTPPRRASRSSTPPTPTRSAATSRRRPHRGDRRQVAEGQARPVRRRDQVLRADGPRTAGTWATAAGTSWIRSTRRCAGCRPTSSTCTNCISTIRGVPLDESLGALERPRARRQGALHRLLELPRVPARARGRQERGAGHRPLRLGPTAVQPVVPRVRARAVPVVPRGGHRRDPLQPDRGRDAVGEARPVEAARRRDTLHARQRGAHVPGSLLARQRVRHRRRSS